MDVENIILEEINPKRPPAPRTADGLKCLFYKTEHCQPAKMKFKICAKCHRCQVITMENAIPRIFDKIVGLAIFLMGTMGFSSGGSAGSGTAGGSGGGAGGGH